MFVGQKNKYMTEGKYGANFVLIFIRTALLKTK